MTLQRYVDSGQVPGIVAAIERNGRLHVDVMGVKSRESREPVERDSIFRIASMTKPITAAATMALVDDGRLRLDEPVDRRIPELAGRRVLKRFDSPVDD